MVDQQKLWDRETAQSYDTPGAGMDAPAVVDPVVDRLVALAAGGPALEFAVGTGRIALPLRARGVDVTGIELSMAMIERLREKDADIPVVQGDMTATRIDREFSLVYLVFNTIGNLLTQEEQVECFRNAARHLRPGGAFVVELWVPELRAMAPGHDGVVMVTEPGYVLVDQLDPVTQQGVSLHFTFDPAVDGSRDARVGRTPFRFIHPPELDLMARLAGFSLESREADWHGTPFDREATSHVSVYRLPATMGS